MSISLFFLFIFVVKLNLRIFFQIALLSIFSFSIFFLKGSISIHTPTFSKDVPLWLFTEIGLFTVIIILIIYNIWQYFWSIPEKIHNFFKNNQQKEFEKKLIDTIYLSFTGSNMNFNFFSSPKNSILALLCQTLIFEKCKNWQSLQECGHLMLSYPTLVPLGHFYLAQCYEHAQNWHEVIQELLAIKRELKSEESNLLPILQNRLFLSFLKYVKTEIDYSLLKNFLSEIKVILSSQQLSILLSTQAQYLKNPTFSLKLYQKAYALNPYNIEAICAIAPQLSEAIALKKLLKSLQYTQHPMILEAIVSRNTQLNRLEIYQKVQKKIPLFPENPESYYTLAQAALSAGLHGEALHYLTELSKLFMPLTSLRLQKLKEKVIHSSTEIEAYGKDVYECQHCYQNFSSWSPCCPQCGFMHSLSWNIIEN